MCALANVTCAMRGAREFQDDAGPAETQVPPRSDVGPSMDPERVINQEVKITGYFTRR